MAGPFLLRECENLGSRAPQQGAVHPSHPGLKPESSLRLHPYSRPTE